MKNLMNVKDTVPRSLRADVVYYKFNYAECTSSYAGETSRNPTRVREHLSADKNSTIFKHLKSSDSCFTILDSASTYHQPGFVVLFKLLKSSLNLVYFFKGA